MHLGIDIGSVSIKYALLDQENKIVANDYFRTHGDLLGSIVKIVTKLGEYKLDTIYTTGSARKFIYELIGADGHVDEITAHRTAIQTLYPEVRTIFEIGGQDSKLIYFSDLMVNFEMNHVCAAGTGSFLDQQASRLGLSIVQFYELGLKSTKSHKIASKCTVFAETDMIHAQQSGIPIGQIVRGVHRGMIGNYFSQLCLGKQLQGKFLFEGGTAENPLLVEELAKKLVKEQLIEKENDLVVPKPYHKVIGAIGAAFLGKKSVAKPKSRQLAAIENVEFIESIECRECANKCGAEVSRVRVNKRILTIGKSCRG
jgi:predicted CoA-substrate-specific enzyme activase